jgi:hypothetical protein
MTTAFRFLAFLHGGKCAAPRPAWPCLPTNTPTVRSKRTLLPMWPFHAHQMGVDSYCKLSQCVSDLCPRWGSCSTPANMGRTLTCSRFMHCTSSQQSTSYLASRPRGSCASTARHFLSACMMCSLVIACSQLGSQAASSQECRNFLIRTLKASMVLSQTSVSTKPRVLGIQLSTRRPLCP